MPLKDQWFRQDFWLCPAEYPFLKNHLWIIKLDKLTKTTFKHPGNQLKFYKNPTISYTWINDFPSVIKVGIWYFCLELLIPHSLRLINSHGGAGLRIIAALSWYMVQWIWRGAWCPCAVTLLVEVTTLVKLGQWEGATVLQTWGCENIFLSETVHICSRQWRLERAQASHTLSTLWQCTEEIYKSSMEKKSCSKLKNDMNFECAPFPTHRYIGRR